MSFYFVPPETYHAWRDQVMALSNSVQRNHAEHLPAESRTPALTDAQIAERLGLETRVVTEIRCVAEREMYGLDEWEKAMAFKEKACRDYARQGLSSVTRPYFEAKKREAGES